MPWPGNCCPRSCHDNKQPPPPARHWHIRMSTSTCCMAARRWRADRGDAIHPCQPSSRCRVRSVSGRCQAKPPTSVPRCRSEQHCGWLCIPRLYSPSRARQPQERAASILCAVGALLLGCAGMFVAASLFPCKPQPLTWPHCCEAFQQRPGRPTGRAPSAPRLHHDGDCPQPCMAQRALLPLCENSVAPFQMPSLGHAPARQPAPTRRAASRAIQHTPPLLSIAPLALIRSTTR